MSEFLARARHFYGQTDGSYSWPNSCEGDLLKIASTEIAELRAQLNDYKNFLKVEVDLCGHRAARYRLMIEGNS